MVHNTYCNAASVDTKHIFNVNFNVVSVADNVNHSSNNSGHISNILSANSTDYKMCIK